jgi:hypothetical protein
MKSNHLSISGLAGFFASHIPEKANDQAIGNHPNKNKQDTSRIMPSERLGFGFIEE